MTAEASARPGAPADGPVGVAAGPSAGDLPPIDRFEAPAHWRCIDFLSDLHLDPAMPRTFEAWAGHLRSTDADAVFILGDLFEVWIGDDARTGDFESRCARVLAEAADARPVAFMAGNRDFLVGPSLLRETGVIALADPTVVAAFGQLVLLTHGDALCLDDVDYQRFRAQVRQPAWQAAFLQRPLPERRALARQIRDASEQKKAGSQPGDYADVDRAAAGRWLAAANAATLVHGHTHRPGSEPFGPGLTRHVLSDWDLDGHHPGPSRAEVLRWTAGGFERRPPEGLATTGAP